LLKSSATVFRAWLSSGLDTLVSVATGPIDGASWLGSSASARPSESKAFASAATAIASDTEALASACAAGSSISGGLACSVMGAAAIDWADTRGGAKTIRS
jgi:hypothetical protein